jgi:hypothetical protein
MLPISLLGNNAATRTYPGKKSRNGSPRITRVTVIGIKAILRIKMMLSISMINRSIGNLIFKIFILVNYTVIH